MPGVVKYSALARKVTLRGASNGRKKESQKDRWLLARIAGRSSGMFSRPSIQGRQIRRSSGPSMMNLASQNPIRFVGLPLASAPPVIRDNVTLTIVRSDPSTKF